MDNVSCPKCNKINKNIAKFCSSCGYPITNSEKQGVAAKVLTKMVPRKEQIQILQERYKIIKTIKSGGMGKVYLAEDLQKRKPRAVKVMFNQEDASEEQLYAIKRFREEAEILARLDHPNIPSIIDYFTDEGNYYLVMEYIKGEDLETFLRKCKFNIPEKFVIMWAVQLCDVLSYLHNHKPHPILYRDLKPANIMLDKEKSRIYLIDFGIARVINPISSTPKTAVGTEGYAPIEQYKGNAEPRSDIYALGATMHHLLTGEKPIPFSFQPITKVREWLCSDLEKIVMKALEIDIDKRYSNASQMKEELLIICKILYADTYELIMQPISKDKTDTLAISTVKKSSSYPTSTQLPTPQVQYGQVPYAQPAMSAYGQMPPPVYGQMPPGYGQMPPGYGQMPPGYGQMPPGYGQMPPGYGQMPPPVYSQMPPGYGQMPYNYPSPYNQYPQQGFNQPPSQPVSLSSFSQNPLGQQNVFNQVIPQSEEVLYGSSESSDISSKESNSSYSSNISGPPKDEIEKLIYMMKSPDDTEKAKATAKIIEKKIQDPRLVEPLIEAMDDRDWNVRRESAIILGNHKSRKALTVLVKALNDEHTPVRLAAVEALGKIKDKYTLDSLFKVLKDDMDDGVRRQTVLTLGEIEEYRSIPQLINALSDPSVGVKLATIETLGKFRDVSILAPLEKIAKDKNLTLAVAAHRSISKIKPAL